MVFLALTIAGSDSGGGAGVQADLKTFAAHRVHGLSVIVSLTAQNTSAVKGVLDVSPRFIEAQFDALREDFDIGAAKTGMLSTARTIRTVAKNLGDYPLVVDPVMVSESGGRLLAEDAIETLKEELLPKAAVVTPNIYEAEILSGMAISSLEDMKEACKRISRLGCGVVIKGGHLNATDLLYADRKFHIFPGELLDGSFHGSGCTFSAAITANLAMGFDLVDALSNSKAFIRGALGTAYRPGKGRVNVVNQTRTSFEEGYDPVRLALRKAVSELEAMKGLHRLMPEVGMNICHARKGAVSLEDVAAVTGRIIRVGEMVRAVGGVEYGASRHMARVVLAAMGFDGRVRAAANIKYRPETVEALESAGGFAISSFDRGDEPKQVESTMEWGTKEAVRRLGRVPDLIFDRGGAGKEPMIRVLGRDPDEVVSKLRRILGVVCG
ncbi:MAG: bifunctional hydroxymethylpyrimidine kinase/phosphomethylpyrimidine kinase [Methanobacteriota archaeon]|nr:MAG: bifunctional hydroxymethylpyrimidine kinase/phosphomethylpyrimidine kinase [Euryarchaeota archaeon]